MSYEKGLEFSVFRKRMGQPNTDMRLKVKFSKLYSQKGTGWSVVGICRRGIPAWRYRFEIGE